MLKTSGRTITLALLMPLAFLFVGCTTSLNVTSPNAEYYPLVLLQHPNPSTAQIFAEGLIHQSNKSVSETWNTCLKIAAQSQGILMIDDSVKDAPRMVIVCGLPTLVNMPLRSKEAANAPNLFDLSEKKQSDFRQFIRFMDVWMAIAVKPGLTPGTSRLAVACFDPSRSRIQPFETVASDYSGAASGGPSLGAAQQWSKTPAFRSAATSNWADPEKAPDVRWKSVPLLAADEFLMTFEIQSTGPDAWGNKFRRAAPLTARGAPRHVQQEQAANVPCIVDHGNWCASYLRRTVYVLDCPTVVDALTGICSQLLQAAHQEGNAVHVYVIASPDINAFSLPNGDVYVCAGLLDMLSDADEAAAVLAHEIDHFLQQDATRKICADYDMQVTIDAVTFVVSTAASVAAGQLAQGAAHGVGSMSAQDVSDLTQDAGKLADALSQSTMTMVGSSINRAFIMGYSQQTELRADANAVRYTFAAGYDPRAFSRVFAKLEHAELNYTEQKQLAYSHLINSQPGLKQRESDLCRVLEALDRPSDAPEATPTSGHAP